MTDGARRVSCSWCRGPVSARARFGSQRQGLDTLEAWACDSCLDLRAFEQPPAGWTGDTEGWSAGEHKQEGHSLAASIAVVLAIPMVLGLWVAIEAGSIGAAATAGFVGTFLLGGMFAFMLPFRLPVDDRRSAGASAALMVVIFFGLRTIDRAVSSRPGVAFLLACVGSIAVGWLTGAMVRFVLDRHRRESTGLKGSG